LWQIGADAYYLDRTVEHAADVLNDNRLELHVVLLPFDTKRAGVANGEDLVFRHQCSIDVRDE
jgi:hypothetical protein